MFFFADTNISLAYTVVHDKWHENATKFVNNHKNDTIFWSTLVKEEFKDTLDAIIDDVVNFLETSEDLLNNNQK